ncbi:beta-galactosidase [Rhodopirellula sallentina]|uniref:Beta-agarase n=1 Tax=Rhodopirellula sallentina SM41 TaxID=1263870 RepID=M5ULG0_9BACT|nr:beta-galactosidase [Rhodopirellula sallentina]EMI56858.1 Beta-agarase [Rhodopirellula sallentina SM41]
MICHSGSPTFANPANVLQQAAAACRSSYAPPIRAKSTPVAAALTLSRSPYCVAIVLGMLLASPSPAHASEPDSREMLFHFEDDESMGRIESRGIEISRVDGASGSRLMLHSRHDLDWPGITLKPESTFWNGAPYQRLALDVQNTGEHAFELGLRIDNPGGDGQSNSVTKMTFVKPGDSVTVSANLSDTPWQFSSPLKLEGMHAAPGQQSIDPAKINEVILFLRTPREDHEFTIDNVRFEQPVEVLDPETFLPFIDEYGQFIHGDWPGKIHSDAQLHQYRDDEAKVLAESTGPTSFNRFGGWKDGPQRDRAKFFRVEKHDGVWWLIDPDGCRFWSHGIDSVSTRFGGTGTQHRETYFRNLPSKESPLGQFYFQSTWAFGFYADRIPFEMYNFYAANLFRKYGENWKSEFTKTAHQRLRHWGMNTLASWSDSEVYLQHKTPYVAFFRAENCPTLQGAEKRWTTFVDVFDPQFRTAVIEGIDTCHESLGDPWCIGFYVDNELYWGNNESLALWTLACPPEQAAKKVFIEQLRDKYETVEELNASWGTEHESWDALATATQTPDVENASEDLLAFSKQFADTYFGTVKGELAKAAPGQLYLGCRFIWYSDVALRAASKFCDVVSFNQYRYSVADLQLPEGEDKPIIVGEFHFGALDRGLFHPTKVPAKNQEHRAECYKNFLNTALKNPRVVGTHWFQYTSEPTAGRGDGENYQVGFVDNCDTPYPETIAAAQEIGANMYKVRSNNP